MDNGSEAGDKIGFALSTIAYVVRLYCVKGRIRTRDLFDPPSHGYGATSSEMAGSPTRAKRAARRQKDMSAFSFVLTLLLIATVGAATADHPTFWLLLGPAPLAGLMGAAAVIRSRGLQRSNQ